MKRALFLGLIALVSVAFVDLKPAWSQTARQEARQLRGRVVQTFPDYFVVQTADNQKQNVYFNPQTRYLANNQAIQYSDLRVGNDVTTTYVLDGNRYIANNVVVGAVQANDNTQKGNQAAANRVQGRIDNLGTDHFSVQNGNNPKMTFAVHPQTKFVVNNKTARYTDLKVGEMVTVVYSQDGNRNLANEVIVGAMTAQSNQNIQGTLVEGQVVRVVNKDQVVVRTANGKEVILYTSPQTVYQFNNQPGQFTDLQPGMAISGYYDVRDQRFMARRLFNRPNR